MVIHSSQHLTRAFSEDALGLCHSLSEDIACRFDAVNQAHSVASTDSRDMCVALFHRSNHLFKQFLAMGYHLFVTSMPGCRVIVVQHAVSNSGGKRQPKREIIDSGLNCVICSCLYHALLFPCTSTRLPAGIETRPHPGTFSAKHEHCCQTSTVGDTTGRQNRDSACDIYHCYYKRKCATVSCVTASLSALSNERINACLCCRGCLGHGLHLRKHFHACCMGG